MAANKNKGKRKVEKETVDNKDKEVIAAATTKSRSFLWFAMVVH